jgi:hypothetical protein
MRLYVIENFMLPLQSNLINKKKLCQQLETKKN